MNQENKANEEKWKLEFAESRRCFEELRKPTQKQIWGYRQGALDGFIEAKRSSQVEIDKLCEENERLRQFKRAREVQGMRE